MDHEQRNLDQERAQPSRYHYGRRDDRKSDLEAAVLRTVRAWCGEGEVERHDEPVALRAEVIRLGELVEKVAKALRDRGHGVIASIIERDPGVHIAGIDPEVCR